MEERREIHTGDGRILKQVESRLYDYRYPGVEDIYIDPNPGTFYFDHGRYVLNPEDSKGSLSFRKEGGESLCPGIWDEEDKIYTSSVREVHEWVNVPLEDSYPVMKKKLIIKKVKEEK